MGRLRARRIYNGWRAADVITVDMPSHRMRRSLRRMAVMRNPWHGRETINGYRYQILKKKDSGLGTGRGSFTDWSLDPLWLNFDNDGNGMYLFQWRWPIESDVTLTSRTLYFQTFTFAGNLDGSRSIWWNMALENADGSSHPFLYGGWTSLIWGSNIGRLGILLVAWRIMVLHTQIWMWWYLDLVINS